MGVAGSLGGFELFLVLLAVLPTEYITGADLLACLSQHFTIRLFCFVLFP